MAAGLFLLFLADTAGLEGFATGLSRSIREGPAKLAAAAFVNSLTLYLGLAIYILLRQFDVTGSFFPFWPEEFYDRSWRRR